MKFNYTLKRRANVRKGIAIFVAMLMMPLLCLQIIGNTAKSEQLPEASVVEEIYCSVEPKGDNRTADQPEARVPEETDELVPDGQISLIPAQTGEFFPDEQVALAPVDADELVPAGTGALIPNEQVAPVTAEMDELVPDGQKASVSIKADELATDGQETPVPADTYEFAPYGQKASVPIETDEFPADEQEALIPVEMDELTSTEQVAYKDTPTETDDHVPDEQAALAPADTDEFAQEEQVASDDTPAELNELESLESALLAEGYAYAATIDLSARSDSFTGVGYTISGGPGNAYDPKYLVTNPKGGITFNTGANGKAYRIIQTGVPNTGVVSSKGAKYGTSMIMSISVLDGVSITLILSDIHLIGSIELAGTANVNLLLDGHNYIRTSIWVPSTSEITIDSLNGSNGDSLIMPSEVNTSSDNAKIGGCGAGKNTYDYSAGKITIKGGVIDITARSTGACIGGGGNINGYGTAGNADLIMIKGGSVFVTQYGSGNETGIGLSGAGIGGGGGDGKTTFGGAGNVIITGGMVTVRQYTRAAGIGGGTHGPAGNITIEGGNIDVEVIRLVNETGSGEGSGIGTAAGANPGTGNITISGGTVRSIAYMTGIGRVHGNDGTCILNISITGGTVYAKGKSGPGIGSWCTSLGNTITITGGTVIAESELCSGIGGRSDYPTYFHLDATANVRAYTGGYKPAINAGNNKGNGYFVNAILDDILSKTAATTLNVYSKREGVLQKTLMLPAAYKCFAYSSDLTVSRTDNILAYNNSSALMGAILRSYDSSPELYSIISLAGYNAHTSNKNEGMLKVKLGVTEYFTVNEKYVDIYGNSIEGVDNSMCLISRGSVYNKEIPTISGYIGKGHKWDAAPDSNGLDYAPGLPTSTVITENRTVYFVYAPVPTVTELTISKAVAGDLADKTRYFEFTIFFKDSDHIPLFDGTEFSYKIIGAGVAYPSTTFLALDSDGKSTFLLKHGQSIIIEGVPLNSYVRIIETSDLSYDVSFIDSENSASSPTIGNDTGVFALTEGRTIDFTNARISVPLTGLKAGNAGAPLMLPILAFLAGPAYLTSKSARRRRTIKARRTTFKK